MTLPEAILNVEAAETAQTSADLAEGAALEKLENSRIAEKVTKAAQDGATFNRKQALKDLIDAATAEFDGIV